jgi:topoisomerase-4 subunit A
LSSFDLATHFDEDMVHIEKWIQDRPITTVYYDAEKDLHYVKRFMCEVTTDKRVNFISESAGSFMDLVSTAYRPEAKMVYNKLLKETKNLPDNVINLADMIELKGMKAQGNQMTKLKVKEIVLTHPIDEGKEPWPKDEVNVSETDEIDVVDSDEEAEAPTMEWDLTKEDDEDADQMKLF